MGGWTGNGKDGVSWDGKLDSKAGEIQHIPANPKDIVNKLYVDNAVASAGGIDADIIVVLDAEVATLDGNVLILQ